MGTPDFAVGTLDALHDAGHEILAVYTQPDRPKGRSGKLVPSPVKEAAEKSSSSKKTTTTKVKKSATAKAATTAKAKAAATTKKPASKKK